MDAEITTWLNSVSGFVFRTSAVLFVVVNVAAIGLLVSTRSRALVQRWTSPWLAVNLVLLGAGAGVPLVAGIAKAAVAALTNANNPPVVVRVDGELPSAELVPSK